MSYVQSPQEFNNISANQLQDATDSILTNIRIQAIIFAAFISVLFIVRKRNLWLYSPNTRKRSTHPAFEYTKSYFKWLLPIMFVDDVTLVSIIGLDAFMLLQVFKMMYRCFFIISLLISPLFYFYYKCYKMAENGKNSNMFVRLSIKSMGKEDYRFLPILFVYLITFTLFYLIYVYYKKYISLRQTYIRSPALLTPLTVLKRASLITPDYIDLVNLRSRTVLLLRIPPFVNSDIELREFVEALGCGEVQECCLIVDNTKIDEFIDQKDLFVREFETMVERAFTNVIKEIGFQDPELYKRIRGIDEKYETKEEARDFDGKSGSNSDDSDDNTQSSEKELLNRENGNKNQKSFKPEDDDSQNASENQKSDKKESGEKGDEKTSTEDEDAKDSTGEDIEKKLTHEDQEKDYKKGEKESGNLNAGQDLILDDLIEGIAKKKTLTPLERKKNTLLVRRFINSNNKYLTKPNELIEKLKKIDEVQRQILQNVHEERFKPKQTTYNIVDMMNQNHSMYTKINLELDTPFFSLYQILQFRKTFHYFTLDLPIRTKQGFITFKDQKAASIITQCLVSSKIFACHAVPAPDPNDIIWENISQSEFEKFFKRIGGNIVNILFIAVFYTLVLGVANIMRIDQLESFIPSIKILTSKRFIRNAYNSAVMPFVFNQMMTLAPFILTILIYYEGVSSYSKLYYKLVVKHTYFLLFNGFIAMMFSATCFEVLLKIIHGDINFQDTAEDVAKNLLTVSVFFTNSIIQRILGGTAFRLLKPAALFIEYLWTKLSAKLFKSVRTRRQAKEARQTGSINFGIEYPNVILVFPMALCYAVIAPIMLILAGIYFLITYLTMKHELLYCLENEFETGGTHWNVITNQMVFSMYIMHLATMCQYLLYDSQWEIVFLLPLIIVTHMFKCSMNNMFKTCTEHFTLNEQEEQYMDQFTKSVQENREMAVKNWDESLDPEDENCIEIVELLEEKDDYVKEMEKLIKERDSEYKKKAEGKVDKKEEKETERKSNIRALNYPYRGIVRGIRDFMFPNQFIKKLKLIKKIDEQDKLEIFTEKKP